MNTCITAGFFFSCLLLLLLLNCNKQIKKKKKKKKFSLKAGNLQLLLFIANTLLLPILILDTSKFTSAVPNNVLSLADDIFIVECIRTVV